MTCHSSISSVPGSLPPKWKQRLQNAMAMREKRPTCHTETPQKNTKKCNFAWFCDFLDGVFWPTFDHERSGKWTPHIGHDGIQKDSHQGDPNSLHGLCHRFPPWHQDTTKVEKSGNQITTNSKVSCYGSHYVLLDSIGLFIHIDFSFCYEDMFSHLFGGLNSGSKLWCITHSLWHTQHHKTSYPHVALVPVPLPSLFFAPPAIKIAICAF